MMVAKARGKERQTEGLVLTVIEREMRMIVRELLLCYFINPYNILHTYIQLLNY